MANSRENHIRGGPETFRKPVRIAENAHKFISRLKGGGFARYSPPDESPYQGNVHFALDSGLMGVNRANSYDKIAWKPLLVHAEVQGHSGNVPETRRTLTKLSLDWKCDFCPLLRAESPHQGNVHFGSDSGLMGVNRADFKVTRGGRNSSELSTNLFHMLGDVLRRSGMLRGAPKWLGNLDSRQFMSIKQTSFSALEYVNLGAELQISIHMYVFMSKNFVGCPM